LADASHSFRPGEQGAEHQFATINNLSGILKLDSHGLPLVPQPSRFKDDPLVSILFRFFKDLC
jgi:hypothetical protein